jgi:carbon storage regulator
VLVIWRRTGESILVGDAIDVEVLEMRPHRVKLGIVAPKSIPIVRKETILTREENVIAALSMDSDQVAVLLTHLSSGECQN